MSKDYCQEIANRIQDYRYKDRKNGRLKIDINKIHVERWADQFKNNQEVVLQETLNLLENYYCSKKDVEDYLTGIYTNNKIWGSDIKKSISTTCFLNCQTKGDSQNRLYKKSCKIINNLYGIDISQEIYNPTSFLYVDDCMFSGNTVRKDIKNLITQILPNSKINLVFMMVHSFSEWSIKEYLKSALQEKNIDLTIWKCYTVQNSGGKNHTYDCLWPLEYQSVDLDVYIETLEEEKVQNSTKKVRLFRTSEYTGGVFTSVNDREIFEQELMEAGLKIRNFSANPKIYMRPMGYDNRISFGFGAFFATYLNMSNNCPLAFWWGDPEAEEWHPFSKWYPLLPRKANENGGVIIEW